MKKSIIVVLAGVALSMFISAATAGPILQMRLVTDTAAGDCDCEDMTVVQKDGDPVKKDVLHVLHKVLIDQTDLKSARVSTDHFGHPEIDIALNENGAKRFAEVTRTNLHKRLAIIIDGQLYSAPMIQSEIPGGRAVIVGDFSKDEAKELVKKLNEAVKSK
jgi:preprotein translocase subunit SecD